MALLNESPGRYGLYPAGSTGLGEDGPTHRARRGTTGEPA